MYFTTQGRETSGVKRQGLPRSGSQGSQVRLLVPCAHGQIAEAKMLLKVMAKLGEPGWDNTRPGFQVC